MALIHTLSLPTGLKAAREFRAAFKPAMESAGVGKKQSDIFLLAMSEITTNLNKHADPNPDLIRISLRKTRTQWQLSIADNGPPFLDFYSVTETPIPELDEPLESGMGLYLVTKLFSEFKYINNIDSGSIWNELILSLPVETGLNIIPSMLILDDDPIFLSIIDSYLGDKFKVLKFSTAEEALTCLKNEHVDLVISDIKMPEIDGYLFRQKLQNLEGMDTVPFIFLTGEGAEIDSNEAAKLSIDDYLTKPINKNQLIATVRRVMKRAEDLRNRIGDRLDTKITNALIPGFTKNPIGYDAALTHEAATAGGGDILIEQMVGEAHLIILADIMGHGEQAKFFAHALTGYAYGAIKAMAADKTLLEFMTGLSDLFLSDRLLMNSFATALAVMLYPDGTVSIVSAGHPPPIRLSSNSLIELDVAGPLLGLMEEPQFEETRLLMEPNDRLIMFTDGITEADRSLILNPIDLFSGSIDIIGSMSNQQLADDLLSKAQVRNNYHLQDDATAIVISRPPLDTEFIHAD